MTDRDHGLEEDVTAENLVQLGAERLADILLQLAEEQPTVKRRLRLELAGEAGAEIIAAEIGKRITTLRSARSFIDWQRRPGFVRDLDLTRAMIADRLGPARPDLALDLMWRFMTLAEPVINRVDGSNGSVGEVFRTACEDLGALSAKARPNPQALAERVFAAVTKNDYGEFDQLVPVIFPALGEIGVATLRTRLLAVLPECSAKDRFDSQAAAVRRALQDLADGEGDVDAFIGLIPSEDRKHPTLAAGIGRRLLAAGRPQEAIAIVEAATPKKPARRSDLDEDVYGIEGDGPDADWESVYLDALDATGRTEHAQRLRWAAFEERLSVERLRTYLKALPDFDDVLAPWRTRSPFGVSQPRCISCTHGRHRERRPALFWKRHAEIDGNHYYLLDPAARSLEGAHPRAATLLRRAMIEDTLAGAKSKRYRHAARHLAECRSLASLIGNYGQFETHKHFVARLQVKHGRKVGFWPFVADAAPRSG